MGRTACTQPQCLYKGDLYLFMLCGWLLTPSDRNVLKNIFETELRRTRLDLIKGTMTTHAWVAGEVPHKLLQQSINPTETEKPECTDQKKCSIVWDIFLILYLHRNGNKLFATACTNGTLMNNTQWKVLSCILATALVCFFPNRCFSHECIIVVNNFEW